MQPEYRDTLRNIVDEYKEVFPDKFSKGNAPKRDIEHHIETVPGAVELNHRVDHHIDLDLRNRMS